MSYRAVANAVQRGCPTPWKRGWRRDVGFERYVGEGSALEAYHCKCGRWHLATRKEMRRKRLERI